MAIPEFRLCDWCQKPTTLDPVCLYVGRHMDAAGSMDNETLTYDLCGEHAMVLLKVLTSSLSPEGRDTAQRAAQHLTSLHKKGR